MNKKNYRLVFSRLRGMLVAVGETAAATGKETGQTRACRRGNPAGHTALFTRRPIAFAALALPGMLPAWSGAQIVPGGAQAPSVIQTQNGLEQVNINRPSGAGVSMNTYGQFDVQQNGAILNNSPTIVQTQQAGMINGNPNFGPGQSARVIVNQVNSSAASQINGHLEVAGRRAEVVIANGSGISVNGGGFINTSRAILTTGTPNFAPDGSLAGLNVTGGNISIQGAGLNAGDTDQVDLLSRAVRANAAIHAKNLNVVTGANRIDHGTLNATPIAGDGAAPGVSIDVSQLGGMYANRIVLVGTENGVGVSNKGVLAAQAGDLVLSANGLLTLAGQTNASGSIAAHGRDGINNSGTTYAQQTVTANTSGALTNGGVLAAQQDTAVHAASVASTGTLGAGVNGDGSLAQSGDLSVTTGGTLAATGRNAAGGNATLSGTAVNLAGSDTSTNGTLALAARSGELNLSGATTTAGGELDTRAAGMLTNDGGVLSSGGGQTIMAGALSNNGGTIATNGNLDIRSGAASNRGGKLAAQTGATLHVGSLDNSAGGYVGADTVSVTDTGALNNSGGTIQADDTLSVSAQSVDNDGGSIANGGTGTTTLSASGSVTNTQSGLIGGNGHVSVTGGSIGNAGGTITAAGAATVQSASTLDNRAGLIQGNGNVSASAQGAIDNTGGQIEADGTGNYLVQDPSMLITPSKTLQDLITQNTGGASSPYSWGTSTTQAAAPKIDPYGPFSPTFNTGDYSAGLGEYGRGLAPDYATIGSGSLSASAGLSVNLHDGTTYAAGGVTQSNPGSISVRPGGVASFGWIFGDRTSAGTNSFMNGDGTQGFISIPTPFDVNAFLAITHAYGGSTALEVGVASPGSTSFGVSPFSHSVPISGPKGN